MADYSNHNRGQEDEEDEEDIDETVLNSVLLCVNRQLMICLGLQNHQRCCPLCNRR